VWHDWAGTQGLFNAFGYSSPRQIWQSFHDQGVTHVISLPGSFPASTRGEDVLFSLLLQHAGRGRTFGQFRVDTLPRKPPPDQGKIDVLALGLWGYADGLYPVEAMSVHEGVSNRTYPAAAEALPPDDEGRLALLAKAQVVYMGGRNTLPPTAAGTRSSAQRTVDPLRSRISMAFQRIAGLEGGLELFARKSRRGRTPKPVDAPSSGPVSGDGQSAPAATSGQ
jgi:hypothetical protein